ncbi:MAG: TetR/AcrR family transcriptional regulator [SAR324 cluster bacterium]|uniref:TetR/AcrR family transcriptional regulator n=1 Tax=SAR324 cluster bacterium TaxID=2024889 RepID=A0A7X9FQ45_9DELT|nr:TetR/AcrR family transcriptional regulator [SAR324 cluster bacterium]
MLKEKKLSRREREKLLQRDEIMSASLKLFSKKGYSSVSMLEIAKSAEFSVGTLYKFFKNKEDLFKALVWEQFCKFNNLMLKAIDEPKTEIDKLRNYVTVKGEIFNANAQMIRIYYSEIEGARFNFMAGLDSAVKKRHEQFLQKLAGIFDSGMRAKRFKRIAEPIHLAVSLESMVHALLFRWLDAPEANPYPKDPDVILNILFKGLL